VALFGSLNLSIESALGRCMCPFFVLQGLSHLCDALLVSVGLLIKLCLRLGKLFAMCPVEVFEALGTERPAVEASMRETCGGGFNARDL